MNSYIHETAIVEPHVELGKDCKVWHWTHICNGAKIGDKCSFGQNVFVASHVVIGNNVKIQNNVSIYDNVFIEDDVFCGPSMVFTNVVNPRSHIIRKAEYRDTRVRKGVSIGANATIVCGIELGAYSFVAAGAVVVHSVVPYALVAGVPAKQVAWICQCGVTLRKMRDCSDAEETVACQQCDCNYVVSLRGCNPDR